MRSPFLERSLESFARALARAMESEQLANADGLLQRLDPRVKLLGLPSLLIAVVVARNLLAIGAIFALSIVLAACSRVPMRKLAVRTWVAVLAFTGLISLPAVFTTPGRIVFTLPLLHWPATAQGIRSLAYLVSRVETAATLSVLLVLCTPWTHLLRAMRMFRVPVAMVVILGMTHRYIFLLLETASEMFEARRSRMLGRLAGREQRAMAAASAGVLMDKTLHLSGEVYAAMRSRGFQGEVHLLSDEILNLRDYAGLAGFLAFAAAALWLGR